MRCTRRLQAKSLIGHVLSPKYIMENREMGVFRQRSQETKVLAGKPNYECLKMISGVSVPCG